MVQRSNMGKQLTGIRPMYGMAKGAPKPAGAKAPPKPASMKKPPKMKSRKGK